MENIVFLFKDAIELKDIADCLGKTAYRLDLFTHRESELLNIHSNDEWWQLKKSGRGNLYYDHEKEVLKILEKLNPKSIFVVLYHANTLPEMVELFTVILSKYDGWVDCKGDLKPIYTLDNLAEIVSNCP